MRQDRRKQSVAAAMMQPVSFGACENPTNSASFLIHLPVSAISRSPPTDSQQTASEQTSHRIYRETCAHPDNSIH